MQRAFGQVDSHIKGVVKVFQHNAQVVQAGFYKNDIWLETFKLVLLDMARDMRRVTGDPDEKTQFNAEGELDLESYWTEARKNIDEAMAQAASPPDEQKQLIERPSDVQPIEMEFGGDYAPSQDA